MKTFLKTAFLAATLSASAIASAETVEDYDKTTGINLPTVTDSVVEGLDMETIIADLVDGMDPVELCDYEVEVAVLGEIDACLLSAQIQYLVDQHGDVEILDDPETTYTTVYEMGQNLDNLIENAIEAEDSGTIESDDFRDYVELKEDFVDVYEEWFDESAHEAYRADEAQFDSYVNYLRGQIKSTLEESAVSLFLVDGVAKLQAIE